VFGRAAGRWHEEAKLVGADEVGHALFGSVIAISANGATIVACGCDDHSLATTSPSYGYGAVWVFHHAASGWHQQGPKLTATGDSVTGAFGYSVAISGNGRTIVAGGAYVDHARGAVWIFGHTSAGWVQQARLTGAGETTGDSQTTVNQGFFGDSVAISATGNALIVGASGQDRNRGGLWFYTRSRSGWHQQGPIVMISPHGESGHAGFGGTVTLSTAGNVALVPPWVMERCGSSITPRAAGTRKAESSREPLTPQTTTSARV